MKKGKMQFICCLFDLYVFLFIANQLLFNDRLNVFPAKQRKALLQMCTTWFMKFKD